MGKEEPNYNSISYDLFLVRAGWFRRISCFRDKLIEQLKGTFGKYYDYHRRDIAANEVDYLNVEDPDVFSHRAWELEYQRKQEIRRNQPARTKKRSYDMEL